MGFVNGQALPAGDSGAQPRVVVKMTPPKGPSLLSAGDAVATLLALAPDVPARPYFNQPGAFTDAPGDAERRLVDFVAVDVDSRADGEALAARLNARTEVEIAFVEGGPTPPPAAPTGTNPRATNQGYLDAAPKGIDARWAWVNATGQSVGFVDLEQGWTLTHQDLSAAKITLISGLNHAFPGHGTAVLGEVAAVDNNLGVVGIDFAGRARVISQWRTASNYDTAAAILAASQAMAAGDVLLLEAQTTYSTTGQAFVPVEVEDQVFAAIQVAVERGIIVVEAAGNGSVDLDTFRTVAGKAILDRNSADFRDSGAIMVGAASSSTPHRRMNFSNFGSRIDCYAWGENVETCGDGGTGNANATYTSGFGGTSSASPIVTGAALLIQSWARAQGRRYTPRQMRDLLSDSQLNTQSAASADEIGVMPNLRKILTQEQQAVAAPPAAVTVA